MLGVVFDIVEDLFIGVGLIRGRERVWVWLKMDKGIWVSMGVGVLLFCMWDVVVVCYYVIVLGGNF